MSNVISRAQDVPDAHKIAVYDALCAHFATTLDSYYDDDGTPTDPRYDSGVVSPDDPPTHTVGMEVAGDGDLYVVLNIKGWADLIGFSIELPTLSRDDAVDASAGISVVLPAPAGQGRADG